MVIQIVAFAVLTLAVAVLMEGVTWALHKYGMHDALWVLHEDHHQNSGKSRGISFGFLYAPPRYNTLEVESAGG